ncbi:MAG: mechanosensitive ion channel family protein [Pseudomonadota bacterium]
MGSLLPSADSGTEDLETARISEIMRQAAENGVSVVVIDQSGAIVTSEASPPVTASSSEQAISGSALMRAQDSVAKFRDTLVERMLDLPDALNEMLFILRASSPDGTIWAFFEALYISLALFAVGIAVEKLVYGPYFARPIVVARSRDKPQGYSEKMPFLVFRFFMGVTGILVSMAVAYVIGFAIYGTLEDSAIQFTASIINAAYFLSRTVAQLWRMILSPFLPQYRMPFLDTPSAVRLYRWLVVMASVDIWADLFGTWIAELGLNYDVYAFFAAFLSGVVVLLNVTMILVNRQALSNAIRLGKSPAESNWAVRTVSAVWAPAAILYFIVAWIDQTYDLVLGVPSSIPLIAGAYMILMSILVVYGAINFVIERSFARARAVRAMNEAALAGAEAVDLASEDFGEATLAHAQTIERGKQMTTFEGLAQRIAGILALVAGINAFFYIWDTDGTQMVQGVAGQFLDILAILFLGYIAYHAFRIWIDRKISEEQGEMEEGELGDEGGGNSASRLATLLPLFRNFILIILVVTIILIILLEMGVNVGPLFAGAGVVGVAVGFGSQALVRDIFSGGFFLFDDAFRKGEYLDVGGVKGTVEKISVRSFQLRHHLGALHTIPFGEIQVMTNYSRDWVIMKLPLRVTYDTNVEKVRKLIKNLGVQLLDDPVIGDNFIQPLKSQGVIEMQDSAMIIRVKFMTKPGDQWLVRKKVYEEIRALFELEGIKFAHREVTVRLAGDRSESDLTDEDRQAISAAAEAALEEDLLEGGVDDGGDDR